MRIVVQRVSEASVFIAGESKANIENGLLVLLGIEHEDASEDVLWLVRKITQLRIFPDENEVKNRSVVDVNGEVLVVSQFTLHASTKKGNRPSYIKAARPEQAIPLYEHFVSTLQMSIPTKVQTGEFGADMKIKLINDGPVTIIIDSKIKE